MNSIARILITALLLSAALPTLADYHATLPRWQAVLEAYVDDQGRTDFVRLATSRSDLDAFVRALERDGPRSNPARFDSREAQLAFHINAYNALAMHGILERGIPKNFSSFFKRARFFRFRSITVDGDETNLYDYENKVIRKLNDPRVHFALNCMVRDCPRLPQTPFIAAEIDAQLDALSREFFSKSKHIRVENDVKRLHLSSILDFYTEDFTSAGEQGLIEYVNQWRDTPVPRDFQVEFIEYDWTVNQAP